MSATYRIQSVCECQAILKGELNEERLVLKGWCARGRVTENAPANSVGAAQDRFDVVWQCAMCGRNSLRTFYQGALQRLPQPPPEAAPAEPATNAEEGSAA